MSRQMDKGWACRRISGKAALSHAANPTTSLAAVLPPLRSHSALAEAQRGKLARAASKQDPQQRGCPWTRISWHGQAVVQLGMPACSLGKLVGWHPPPR